MCIYLTCIYAYNFRANIIIRAYTYKYVYLLLYIYETILIIKKLKKYVYLFNINNGTYTVYIFNKIYFDQI